MKTNQNRRDFLKTMAVIPAIPALSAFSLSGSAKRGDDLSHKFKLSLNLYSFNQLLRDGKVDLFDMLRFCAAQNFDAIDPTGYYFPGYPTPPSTGFINEFKREAFLLGLDISGTGVRNDFANPDPAARKADIELVKQWIEVAAKMGAPNLRVFGGTNPHEGFTRDQVFRWMAEDIRTCCDYGKEFGVIIAIQNHNDFIKTAADVDRIFDMVDSDWLGLNLDIGSYRQGDPYAEIEKNISKAVTWQIKENVWIDGKETPVDLEKLFSLIKKAGYRGYLPIETLGAGDPYQKVPRLLNEVRQNCIS
ncbi:MAG: xylose isomerase [Bacteroidetes bacterium GWD2_45_23]|nr:MAG: xylose isomerase [Bacteroidetes bacterium GWC2_46_850]OFX84641.1 MAG: xylose isomerase [Bacteroidetes bacterium GWD2_45_23]HAR37616.1 sugar phosphate isomerase/epimerase [Porphyromonadaceae bacterium]HBB00117.1 sugar phosphate isomerase/epimerase [Porphyromonadaceae bacterium]HCC18208.1 sugar phosphate isomerase/epimerase [Porphyromonadaceae bacterium]